MNTFFNLDDIQLAKFDRLKTSADMRAHGPLDQDQEVPIHSHAEMALYVVRQGLARFTDGVKEKVLGCGAQLNAVVVRQNQKHGWKALAPRTIIEHVFGDKHIGQIAA